MVYANINLRSQGNLSEIYGKLLIGKKMNEKDGIASETRWGTK